MMVTQDKMIGNDAHPTATLAVESCFDDRWLGLIARVTPKLKVTEVFDKSMIYNKLEPN